MANIPPHLVKKAWEMYRFHSEGNGVEPDELQFVSTDEPIASVISLRQPKKPRKAKSGAERARAYRERKKGRRPPFFIAGPGRDAGRAFGTMFHPHRPQAGYF